MVRGAALASIALITESTGTPTLEEWAKLDLSAPDSRVLRLTRVRLDANGPPLGVEEVVLALDRFPGLLRMVVTFQTPLSLPSVIACRSGVPLNGSASSKPQRLSRCISCARGRTC